MAMICKKCGRIIPDVVISGNDRNDCRYHRNQEVNVRYPQPIKETVGDLE